MRGSLRRRRACGWTDGRLANCLEGFEWRRLARCLLIHPALRYPAILRLE